MREPPVRFPAAMRSTAFAGVRLVGGKSDCAQRGELDVHPRGGGEHVLVAPDGEREGGETRAAAAGVVLGVPRGRAGGLAKRDVDPHAVLVGEEVRGVLHVAAEPGPALAQTRVLDDVDVLADVLGAGAETGLAVGVDQGVHIGIGVPRELGVEPVLQFAEVAEASELYLNWHGADVPLLVEAAGLRENRVVGERDRVVADFPACRVRRRVPCGIQARVCPQP